MELRCENVKEAWPRVLGRVLNLGQIVDIKGYGKTLELDEPMMVRIREPSKNLICDGSGWGIGKLEEYYKQCITPENKHGFDYTYGERLLNYPGIFKETNQVEENMNELDRDVNSRRAVAVTWIPEKDCRKAAHPPCMLFQDRVIRDGKLNMTTYFRSHDSFSAYPSNLYMLCRWLQYDAEHLGVKVGQLYVISNKLHIYARDWEQACIIAQVDLWSELRKEMV